ncbi:MAG: hypothetical protein WCK57_00760 [Verrucomicrobiae bacterium]
MPPTATFTPANLAADDDEEQASGSAVKKRQFSLDAFKPQPMTLAGTAAARQSNFSSLSGIASPSASVAASSGAAVRPRSPQDNVDPLAGQQNIAAARTAGTGLRSVPIQDKSGRVVRMDTRAGGIAPSLADWQKPGAPGWQAQKAGEGKTPLDAAVEGKKLQATQDLVKQSGQDPEEFYRTHNYDGSEKDLNARVAPTGIDGLKPESQRVKDVANSDLWKGKQAIPSGQTPESVIAANRAPVAPVNLPGSKAQIEQATGDASARALNLGTVAVDPKYAGPGQLSAKRGADGNVSWDKAPGVREDPNRVSVGGVPTKFVQGSGVVVDMAANPDAAPLPALSGRTFLGDDKKEHTPSLFFNTPATPAQIAKKGKTVPPDPASIAALNGIKNATGS